MLNRAVLAFNASLTQTATMAQSPGGLINNLLLFIDRIQKDYWTALKVPNQTDYTQRVSDEHLKKLHKSEVLEILLKFAHNMPLLQQHAIKIDRTTLSNASIDHVIDKVSKKVADETKHELAKMLSTPPANERKKLPVSNETQVLVIDIEKEDIGEGKNFSNALKKKLSEKLHNVPVAKAVINQKDQAVLFFPDSATCTQAKSSLQTFYDVKNSDRKQNILQPRIKIHHIDSSLANTDPDVLTKMIMSKNISLQNAQDQDFKITYVDNKQNFAVAKVSPDIHACIMKNGRIYIDLCSYMVSDHFFPLQCYRCQNFGHLSTSCKAKTPEIFTCLYCSANHRSSSCPSKKNKKEHKCANCLGSKITSIKNKSNSHTATSKLCPIFIKEVERLKDLTCYDQKVFLNAKN